MFPVKSRMFVRSGSVVRASGSRAREPGFCRSAAVSNYEQVRSLYPATVNLAVCGGGYMCVPMVFTD